MKIARTAALARFFAWSVIAAFLAAAPVRAQTLEVSGGLTFLKDILEPNAQTFKDKTGSTIKYAGVTTGVSVLLLIEGKSKAAIALDSLEEATKQAVAFAKDQGTQLVVPNDLVYKQFASDKLVMIVNNQNPVSAISKAQFKDIAAGKITNWKQLGGQDMPIKVITGTPTTATRRYAERMLLDGQVFSKAAIEVRTTPEEVKRVSTDVGAIGFISSRFIGSPGSNIKSVAGPSASRPWGVVTIGKPSAEVQKLIDFLLSPEGQKLAQK